MKLTCTLDDETGNGKTFGLVVLQTDETIEAEFREIFADTGSTLFHTRIPFAAEVTPDTLQQMEIDLPAAVSLFPSARKFDVIGYGCTSGATIIGAERISELIRTIHPDAKTTNPISAVMAAFKHLDIGKIGLVTPYVADVSQAMIKLLDHNGYSVPAFGSFEQIEDAKVARISPGSIFDAIVKIGQSDNVDAVFASCTNLRTFAIIEAAEAKIGKPVITSNQALAWHMGKLAETVMPLKGPGKLFS